MASWNDLQEVDVATIKSAEGLFANTLSVILSLIGIATFLMILVGGFKYLTAGEDPKNAEAAKGTITNGVVGLILAIAAYFILLAIQSFTGVDLMNFFVGI